MELLKRAGVRVPLMLVVGGLVMVSVGVGVLLGWGAGLVAGGICCFVLEWRITS